MHVTNSGTPAQQFNEMMDQIEHLKIAIYENELQQDKTRLQYLSQQIQPHFILNSLNTLYNYSEKDVGTTRSIIRLLSRYYRHVVNVNSSYISLREEFAHIDDYLKLQQIRYPGRFSYEIVCPDSAGKLPVPPFLIESFVGNSIKYALGGKEKVHLTMRAKEAGPGITRITVSDTAPVLQTTYWTLFQNISSPALFPRNWASASGTPSTACASFTTDGRRSHSPTRSRTGRGLTS